MPALCKYFLLKNHTILHAVCCSERKKFSSQLRDKKTSEDINKFLKVIELSEGLEFKYMLIALFSIFTFQF